MTKFYTGYGPLKARGADVTTLFQGEAPIYTTASMSVDDYDRLALTCSWVYACIDTIAKEAAAATLNVSRQVGEDLEEVPNHPFEVVMRRPNPFMSRQFFKRYVFTWWLLRGESYWWPVRDQAGGLSQFWPVPANRMEPIPDKRTYLRGYYYTPRHGEPAVEVAPQNVCYHRSPNPFDYHRGLSPVSAYAMQLKTDRAARQWNLDTFEKGAPLKLIISLPEHMSRATFEQFVADVQDRFTRGERVLYGRGGDIKAEEFGLSPADMEYLAGREFTREEIGMVFGIPAGFWAKDANRANAEAARATMIEKAVWPLLVQFAEDITAQVVQPIYGEEYLVVPEDIRPRDRALQLQETDSKRGVLTFQEARGEAGLDDYAGPLADVVAALPYPLATNAQFVMALAGLGPTMPPGPPASTPEPEPEPSEPSPEPDGDTPAEEMEEMEEESAKAFRRDLDRWKSIARRAMKRGDDPSGYLFESEAIPAGVQAQIVAALAGATTDEEVVAVFAAPFLGAGETGEPSEWPGYP